MSNNNDYFLKVYELVRQVPEGRVSTYGAIAKYLGAISGARMVGWAMNAAHAAYPPVPAHRVVNRNGLLSGKNHFEHPDLMQQLLENENIAVENNQIVNFETIFWDNFQ